MNEPTLLVPDDFPPEHIRPSLKDLQDMEGRLNQSLESFKTEIIDELQIIKQDISNVHQQLETQVQLNNVIHEFIHLQKSMNLSLDKSLENQSQAISAISRHLGM